MPEDQTVFKTFPIIHTQNLVLRKLILDDLDDLYHLYNSSDTQRYQSIHYYSLESLESYILSQGDAFLRKQKIMWAIERKSDKSFVGTRVLYCDDRTPYYEIQGDTKREYWQMGLTKEAYLGILHFLKENNAVGVYSKIQQENINAIKLVQSLGFTNFNNNTNESGQTFCYYAIRFR